MILNKNLLDNNADNARDYAQYFQEAVKKAKKLVTYPLPSYCSENDVDLE